MSDESWHDLISLARAARDVPWFDEQERDYKLEIARDLKSVLEMADDGGDWLARLDDLFRSETYNLTGWRQNRWLLEWARERPEVAGVVAAFLSGADQGVDRFARFARLAADHARANGHAASVIAFGSLFNFAVDPGAFPLIRVRVFQTVERRVGWPSEPSDIPGRYRHHLDFAEEARRRMADAGVAIRDMVDVQGVIYVLSGTAPQQLQSLAEVGHEASVKAWDPGFAGRDTDAPEDADRADGRGVTRRSVFQAIDEYRTLGGEAFLSKYGYGPALRYHLVDDGDLLDSKAIYGVAYGYAHPDEGPLANSDFSGGASQVVKPLRTLGFEIQGDVVEEPSSPIMHLLMRWSVPRQPMTVEWHREVADEHGAVWWGKLGDPHARAAMSEENLARIEGQLATGTSTFVFLYRPGETWRTRIEALQTKRPDDEAELIPEYYRDELGQHHLWLKLADFTRLDDDYPETNLLLFGADGPDRMAGALRGQSSLLYVEERKQADLPRLWWVNQGSSFKRARAGGYLWAPKLDKAGRPKGHWEALTEARAGDLVLNYASGSIRGVSRVEAPAVDATRPDPAADAQWNEDGWLVQVAYRDLSEPVALTDIPDDWRRQEQGPFTVAGAAKQGYFFPVSQEFTGKLAGRFPKLGLSSVPEPASPSYEPPSFDAILSFIDDAGMSLARRLVRRYHLSLKTRGFVILSGISGTGKTWLAELYAEAVGASHLLVAVAPNWTTNEDLLGYLNPLTDEYHDTPFSRFLREAAEEYETSMLQGRTPRPFHLTLDEMNLARVEYYFARFLSAMEVRSRDGTAAIELATGHEVLLTPNLMFTGTVNVDETTHGFADKVYDRAQLLELVVPRDDLLAHIQDAPYANNLMAVWDAVEPVAPFAFRVLDEVRSYVDEAQRLEVPWQEAVDEQLLQKVLPKLKGADLRLEQSLTDFIEASGEFPLSQQKATSMLDDFNQHGFTSFF